MEYVTQENKMAVALLVFFLFLFVLDVNGNASADGFHDNNPSTEHRWCYCYYWCAWYGECCEDCPDVTIQELTTISPLLTPFENVFIDPVNNPVYNFKSLNSSGNYPNKMAARWNFTTSQGFQLLLKFHVLVTEEYYDYVRVGNGNTMHEQAVFLWSGGPPNGNVQVLSLGNTQWMTFITDSAVTAIGIAGSVEAVNMARNALDCKDDFKCVNDGVCIPHGSVCDYVQNCGSGDDQKNCNSRNNQTTTPSRGMNQTTTQLYPDFDVRLVGGTNVREGRVEVFHQGLWGTVCDDYWDINDAIVVCKQLGYKNATGAFYGAYFGQGVGQILMDDVRCTGSETSLDQCPHGGFGSHNCDHTEDAGVRCVDPKSPERKEIVLRCSSTSFQVDIPEWMVSNNLYGNELYLAGDSKCKSFYYGDYYISLNSSLTECGTQYFENNTHSFYQNTVVNSVNNASVIEYMNLEIPIVCEYDRLKTLQSHYVTINEKLVKQEKGVFEYDFAMYTDINYAARYYTYPVKTTLNTELYFRAELIRSPRNLEIHLRSCRATPSPNFDDPTVYEFIRDGCEANNAVVRVLIPNKSTQADFEITSFRFREDLDNPESQVWIHCEVIICDSNDTSSECRRGCEQTRHRRSVGTTYQKARRMVQGPILLRQVPIESKTGMSEKKRKIQDSIIMTLAAVSLVMFIGLLVMSVTLFNVVRRSKQEGY